MPAIAVAPLERRAWSWRSHEEPGPSLSDGNNDTPSHCGTKHLALNRRRRRYDRGGRATE